MLRIVAAAYRDGWAFVEDRDRTFLVRPPYRKAPLRDVLGFREPIEVPRAAAQEAVEAHGFEAQEDVVPDLQALVAFLETRRVELADAEGTPSLSDEERMQRLVRSAPRHVLSKYLDRVEGELLPKGEIDAALRVLAAMSHAGVAHADDALRERVSRMIAACGDELSWRRAVIDRAAASRRSDPAVEARLARKFPFLARRGQVADVRAYEERRASAGQMFPLYLLPA